MKVTLTKIYDKERTSKTGRPFTSRAIKTNEHGDKWLSGFKGKENEHWAEGDTVDIDVEQKGEFLNYSVPKGGHQTVATGFQPSGDLLRVERKVDAVMTEIQMIRSVLGEILQKIETRGGTEIPDFN